MGNTPENTGIDFSDLGGTSISPISSPAAPPVPPSGIDFSDIGGKPISPITTQTTPPAAQTTPDQQPMLSRAWNAVKQEVAPVISASMPQLQNHKEDLAYLAGGMPAVQAYRTSQNIVQKLEGLIKAPAESYQQMKADFARGVQDFQNKDYRNVASDVVSTATDVSPVIAPMVPNAGRVREFSEGSRPGGDLVTPTVKTALDVGTAALLERAGIGKGSSEEGAAETTATTPKEAAVANATSKSGISVGTPETVAPSGESIQPTLHQSIRNFVNKTNTAAGLPPVADDVNILDAAQNQADAFQVRSQAAFKEVEKITGVNPTTLKQIMKTRADQIETFQAAGKDEEAGTLQQLQLNDENRMEKAFNQAKDKGVNVDQARSDWNKSLRADELSTAIRGSKSNLSTLESPDLDPNKLTSRLQKLHESQPGGKTAKLAQLGGDQNATNLVERAETARDAARTIKEFVPQSATGQQALSKIVSDNTIEKSSLIRGGKAVGRTDWNGVVKDIGNLTPEQQNAFGGELAQVRLYAGKQALRQNAVIALKWGARAVGLGAAGEIGYELAK